MDNLNKHVAILIAVLLIWLSIWILSAEFFRIKLDDLSNSAIPWLAFLVGPPGVWTRWHLARLNGQGLGRQRMLKWLPIGTLLANVLAACIMAALATVSKAVIYLILNIGIILNFYFNYLNINSNILEQLDLPLIHEQMRENISSRLYS